MKARATRSLATFQQAEGYLAHFVVANRVRVGVWIAALSLFFGIASASETNGLLLLLTDKGDRDGTIAAVKGAIYSKNVNAALDTITLNVPPYNVRQAAYLLDLAAKEFPAGTVFCSMVESGPGGKHTPIAVQTEDGKIFVEPDDGLLTLVLRHFKMKEAREITNPVFLHDAKALESNFPDRDIYAPAAAMLAKGEPFASIGSPVKTVDSFKITEPALDGKTIVGEVQYITGFGELITNIPSDLIDKLELPQTKILTIEIGSESMEVPLIKNPSEVREGWWYGMIEPFGNFEIGRNGASANALLQVDAGTPIKVHVRTITLKPLKY